MTICLLASSLGHIACQTTQGVAHGRVALHASSPAGAPTGASAYRVRQGDSWAAIARRARTSPERLAQYNRRQINHAPRVGEMLLLPTVPHPGRVPPSHVAQAFPSHLVRLRWPVEGTLTSSFGHRWGRMHDGIDIGAAEGTAIRAAADGKVAFAGPQHGYGNLVIVRHAGGVATVYAHARKNLVVPGQKVLSGQTIALVGQTGRATGPHLHFEVRHGVQPLDPHPLLPQRALASRERASDRDS